MLNSSVIGNLGADAEIKEINGKKCLSFSVAHTENRSSSNEKESSTIWVHVLWYGQSDNLLNRLKKGTKVYVSGRTQVSIYTSKTGTPQLNYKLFAQEVLSLSDVSTTPTEPQ